MGVVGVDEAAHSELGSRNTHDDFILDDQRGSGDRAACAVIRHDSFPEEQPCIGIQANEMCVRRPHVELIAEDRWAAIL